MYCVKRGGDIYACYHASSIGFIHGSHIRVMCTNDVYTRATFFERRFREADKIFCGFLYSIEGDEGQDFLQHRNNADGS